MAVRILWDEYETALLLDAYFQVQGGEISRKDAVANISRCLRYHAIAKGFDIDESWRNAIGISSQMGRIEMIFSPSEKTAKYPPKLFNKTECVPIRWCLCNKSERIPLLCESIFLCV